MRKGMGLQTKFSISYIAIIIAVLVLMNTYPLTVSENLTFRSKESTLQNSVSGQSFITLARKVAQAVDNRNTTLPPTSKVETH